MKNKLFKVLTGAIIMIFPFSLLFGCSGDEEVKEPIGQFDGSGHLFEPIDGDNGISDSDLIQLTPPVNDGASDESSIANSGQSHAGTNTGADSGSFKSSGTGASNGVLENYAKGEELCCLVETKAEAEEIAKQYGIELVNVFYGVATFHTDRDPYEVVEEGKKKGFPELSVNGLAEMY